MHFEPSRADFGKTMLLFAFAVLLAALLARPAPAQSAVPLGSSQAVTAEPPVARPAGQPRTVPLFRDFTFTDYASHPFRFQPPAPVQQRWAKIILVCDFSVSAGRQFDRSAEISVGHTNIYFGTTAEPSDTVSPAWHVERDLTEYAALFRTACPGEITIGNTVDNKYTGVIHGTASLLFYPVSRRKAPPVVPDLVLPLPAGGKNGISSADTPTDSVSATYTLPTNTVRAYLDLITESQGDDEFWYLNVPNALTKQLQTGGGTAFREAEISVDGRPAGVAPVFPWIYTGGIDPGLWQPIPGLQTFSFIPYRVNLTPFAGVFDDGKPHTVSVRIFNNQNHFVIAGVLLVHRDPKLKIVRGGLITDTLAPPVPVTHSQITDTNGTVTGPVSVTSERQFTIAGYVLTSAGKVTTKITQTVAFSSVQQFEKSAAKDSQNVQQITSLLSDTLTRTPAGVSVRRDHFRYPLTVDFARVTNPDGSASQTTAIQQSRELTRSASVNVTSLYSQMIENSQTIDTVSPVSTLEFNAAGKLVRRSRRSEQKYDLMNGRFGTHYVRTLTAADGKMISDKRTRDSATHL
jgi:hypothetical protein